MAFFRGPNVVTNGLVLALDAANPKSYVSGSTTWRDLSGNNYSGSLVNGPTFSSNNGGCIVFDGVNDHVSVSSLNLQQNFTLEGWFNQNVLNGFSMFGQGTTALNQGLHIWYVSNTSIRFGMFSNDTDFIVSTSTGNWYNMVFTYNNSSPYTKQMYINGVVRSGTQLQSQSAYAGSGILRLGATYSTGGNYGNGSYAGMKMYNRILSASEVLQNYTSTKSRFNL
jgi:hypothetical protein